LCVIEKPTIANIKNFNQIIKKKMIQETQKLCLGINESANQIQTNNKDKGFWDGERNVGEMLMLVVSELGEAMEAHRKNRFANLEAFQAREEDRITDADVISDFQELIKDTFEDEIADAVIRLLDLSAGLGIDLESHINMKVNYNKSRPKLHGKLY
jgi:NTP pyrophosphatase (non-canonical NTP hydrolase)